MDRVFNYRKSITMVSRAGNLIEEVKSHIDATRNQEENLIQSVNNLDPNSDEAGSLASYSLKIHDMIKFTDLKGKSKGPLTKFINTIPEDSNEDIQDSYRTKKSVTILKKSRPKSEFKRASAINMEQEIIAKKTLGDIMKEHILQSDYVKINQVLASSSNSTFNIFELNSYTEKATMLILAENIFTKLDFFDKKRYKKVSETSSYFVNVELFSRDAFENFIHEMVEGYNRNVMYHNDLHASDVFQTAYVIYNEGKIQNKLNLEDIDIFSLFFSALCHDYKHPGLNNSYQINSQSEIALMYNGKFYKNKSV